MRSSSALVVFFTAVSIVYPRVVSAAPDWPDFYDPFSLHTLYVETVNPDDLAVIKNDTTFDIEVPAYLWVAGEEPVVVSIRRKSASAIPNELAADKKVSFKLTLMNTTTIPTALISVSVLPVSQQAASPNGRASKSSVWRTVTIRT